MWTADQELYWRPGDLNYLAGVSGIAAAATAVKVAHNDAMYSAHHPPRKMFPRLASAQGPSLGVVVGFHLGQKPAAFGEIDLIRGLWLHNIQEQYVHTSINSFLSLNQPMLVSVTNFTGNLSMKLPQVILCATISGLSF